MNESAFPTTYTNTQHGLTKREYIAVEAMKALIQAVTVVCVELEKAGNANPFEDMIVNIPNRSTELADRMIAEFNKSNE